MGAIYQIQPGAYKAMEHTRPPRRFDRLYCELQYMPEDPGLPVMVVTEGGNIETVPFSFLLPIDDCREELEEWEPWAVRPCQICGKKVAVSAYQERHYDCCNDKYCIGSMIRSHCG